MNTQPHSTLSTATICPDCGRAGRAVSAATIESLVTAEARASLASTAGFRFCPTADCPVIYHQPATGQRLDVGAVRVPVFQKSASPERPVCYCFHHTVGEIEAQVRATGASSVPADIKAQCARGLDECERNNPQGACCLGNVSRVVKEALAQHAHALSGEPAEHDCCREAAPASPAPQSRRGRWAALGAMGAAVLSSACCWLPLLLLAFGASAAGVAGFFEHYRPWLLGAAAALLGLGFYFVYFREAKCAPGSACAVPSPGVRRANRILLWTAAVFTTIFALFPNYAGQLLYRERGPAPAPAADAVALRFQIEGMTCEACAAGLEPRLRAVPGVRAARVDYAKREARVSTAPGAVEATVETVCRAVAEPGYRAELKR